MIEWFLGFCTGVVLCIPLYFVGHHQGWKEGFMDYKNKVVEPILKNFK